jgi:hypothetical protein
MAKVVSLHITSSSPSYNPSQKYSVPPYRSNRRLPSSKGQPSHRRPKTAQPSLSQFTTGFAPVTKTELHQLFPYRLVYHNHSNSNRRCQDFKEDPGLLPHRTSSFSSPAAKQVEDMPIIAPSPSPTPPSLPPSKSLKSNQQGRPTTYKYEESKVDEKLFYYHYVPYDKMTTTDKKHLFQMKDLRSDDKLKDFLYKRRQLQPQWPHSVPVKLAYHTAEMSQHYRSTPDKQWNLTDICQQVNSLHEGKKPSKNVENLKARIHSSFASQINATSTNVFPSEDDDIYSDLEDRTLVKLLGSTSNEVLRVISIDDGVNLHKGKRLDPNESVTHDEDFYPENDTSIGFHEDDSAASSQSEDDKNLMPKVNSSSFTSPSLDHFMKPASHSVKKSTAEISQNNFVKRNAILREQMEIFVDWVNVERLKKLENRRCRTTKPTYRTFSAMLRHKHHEESGFFVSSPKARHHSLEPASTEPEQSEHLGHSQQASTSPNELLNIWETLRIE